MMIILSTPFCFTTLGSCQWSWGLFPWNDKALLPLHFHICCYHKSCLHKWIIKENHNI
jgi:hypothetical protein